MHILIGIYTAGIWAVNKMAAAYTRGGQKISILFCSFSKNIFLKFLSFFFKVFPTYAYTLLPSLKLLHSVCKPWIRSTAKVPIYSWNQSHPNSYLIPVSLFSVLETNQSQGAGSGLYGEWGNNCLLTALTFYCRRGNMRGILSCKRDIFLG